MVAKRTSLSTTTSTSSRDHTRSTGRRVHSPTARSFSRSCSSPRGLVKTPMAHERSPSSISKPALPRAGPSGRGFFPGEFNGGDATVKDSKRFADTGGWGYFNFTHHEPKAPTAKVKAKSECAFCHIAGAKRDEVWTQFYPMLDEVPLPQGGRG